MIQNRFNIILLMSLALFSHTFAADLVVKAFVDKSTVPLNQQFTLSIEISGAEAQGAQPDNPNLDAFAVFLGSGSGQNIQIINGKMTATRTISFQYQAVKMGDFTIGKINVKSGNKTYSTKPITLKVVKATAKAQPTQQRSGSQSAKIADDDIFFKVHTSKRSVYPNEPVIVTYMLYYKIRVNDVEFLNLPETAGFWVEDYPQTRQTQNSTEVVNGKRYNTAILKKMALFPMTPGSKTLDPMRINCLVPVRGRSSDIFDDFFSNGFGSTVKKPVATKPVTIEVKPLPETGKPAGFTGVVGQYTIAGSVDKRTVKSNEAVTFSVTVSGKGNIKTIPELQVTFPADFEVYPPQVKESVNKQGTAITGSKTFEWVVIPRSTGSPVIKAVELPVFDPVAQTYNVLKTNPITLSVSKGKDGDLTAPTGLSKEEVQLLGQDIRFIQTDPVSFIPLEQTATAGSIVWVVLVLPLLGLAAAISYSRYRGKLETDVAFARNRRAGKAARKRLQIAAHLMKGDDQKSFYAEAGRSIMGFLGDKLNIPAASIMTDEVRKLLRDRDVSVEAIDHVVSCLDTCDRQRFAPADLNHSEMEKFYKKCSDAINGIDREIS